MIKGINRRLSVILPLSLFISFASYGQVYLGGSVGLSFAHLGNSMPQISYSSGTLITDDYPLKNNNNAAPVYSINAGYEYARIHGPLSLAFGLGVYGNLGNYDFQGQVVETADGDPAGALYNYQYQISTTRLMIEMQMNWLLHSTVPFLNETRPFFNVGIGPAWNKMNGYHEITFNNTSYPPLPPFHSMTQTNFAFQLGCGLSKGFNFSNTKSSETPDRVSIGYRYANSGTTAFGSRGSLYPYSLNTGSLQNNEAYLGYTHLF